jgi:gliding motility-associated lipoprotein GldH
MKYSKVFFGAVFFSVIVLFSGCKPKHTEVKMYFPNYIWDRFEPMKATFEIDKIKFVYEVSVNLGVVDGFELEGVPLEIVVTSPDGQENIVNKTIAVKKDGNYLGKAYGDIWTTELVIYPEKQFSKAGTYSVQIQNRTHYRDLYKTESLTFIIRQGEKVKSE